MAIISRVERALNNKKKTAKTNQRNFEDENLTLEKIRDSVRKKVFNKSKMAKIQDISDTVAFMENKGISLTAYSVCYSTYASTLDWVPPESIDLGCVTVIFQGVKYMMQLYACFIHNDVSQTTAICFFSYDVFEKGGKLYKPLVDIVVSPIEIYPVIKNREVYSLFDSDEFENFSLTAQIVMFKAIDKLFNKAYRKIVDALVETTQLLGV